APSPPRPAGGPGAAARPEPPADPGVAAAGGRDRAPAPRRGRAGSRVGPQPQRRRPAARGGAAAQARTPRRDGGRASRPRGSLPAAQERRGERLRASCLVAQAADGDGRELGARRVQRAGGRAGRGAPACEPAAHAARPHARRARGAGARGGSGLLLRVLRPEREEPPRGGGAAPAADPRRHPQLRARPARDRARPPRPRAPGDGGRERRSGERQRRGGRGRGPQRSGGPPGAVVPGCRGVPQLSHRRPLLRTGGAAQGDPGDQYPGGRGQDGGEHQSCHGTRPGGFASAAARRRLTPPAVPLPTRRRRRPWALELSCRQGGAGERAPDPRRAPAVLHSGGAVAGGPGRAGGLGAHAAGAHGPEGPIRFRDRRHAARAPRDGCRGARDEGRRRGRAPYPPGVAAPAGLVALAPARTLPLPPAGLRWIPPATSRLYSEMLPGWPGAGGWTLWRPLALDPYAAWAALGRFSIGLGAFVVAVSYPWRTRDPAGDGRPMVFARLLLTLIAGGVLLACLG